MEPQPLLLAEGCKDYLVLDALSSRRIDVAGGEAVVADVETDNVRQASDYVGQPMG